MNIGKLPPQAIDLEEAVLGALMVDSSAVDQVADIMFAEMFYTTAHQEIYRAIMSLYGCGEPVDLLTVTAELKSAGMLQEVGGMPAIVKLTDRVVSAANIEYHARIVAQKYVQREIIRTATETIQACYDETEDIFDVISSAQVHRDGMMEKLTVRGEISLADSSASVLEDLEATNNATNGIIGVPSGFIDIDKITGGWQKTDLIIIAARPAMGKTSFVLQTALNAAKRFGRSVAFFSLEMSVEQLTKKYYSIVAQVDNEKIRKKQLNSQEMESIRRAKNELSKLRIYTDDTPAISITELRAKARKMKRKHDIEVIIVDYLQLMTAAGAKGMNREQEISAISRALKGLAKELEVPVIALSQLSRGVESRPNKRPMLSDLRESGAIEQDADMVCFLYRPEYYGITEDEIGRPTSGVAEFLIAKHRHGTTDDVQLQFIGRYTSFVDMAPDGMDIPSDETGIRPLLPNMNFYEHDRDDETPF